MRVLVVEDDNRVMSALRAVLSRHGFEVSCARTGGQALEQLPDGPEVVLLDLGLPDQDGFTLCRRIRQASSVPIIVVTARADFQSRVHGLNIGADDYLVKPYNFAELIARIHAVTRRTAGAAVPADGPDVTEVGALRIDRTGYEVTVDGVPVTLTRKEFHMLLVLARRPGVVYRREQLFSEVWGTDWEGTEDAIIGIHGPLGEDSQIGTTGARISHGCIRLHVKALQQLAKVPAGTPVDIAG